MTNIARIGANTVSQVHPLPALVTKEEMLPANLARLQNLDQYRQEHCASRFFSQFSDAEGWCKLEIRRWVVDATLPVCDFVCGQLNAQLSSSNAVLDLYCQGSVPRP